jgi:hypothetical protein
MLPGHAGTSPKQEASSQKTAKRPADGAPTGTPSPTPKRIKTNTGAHAHPLLDQPPPKGIILDVLGTRNNCGLFALTLGTMRALASNPALVGTAKLPDFVKAVDENTLRTGTKDTPEVGRKLRQEMYQALMGDNIYRERRRNSFVSSCGNFLLSEDENKSFPLDMNAFVRISQPYRQALQREWLKQKSAINEIYKKEEETYRAQLGKLTIQPAEIAKLNDDLKQLSHKSSLEAVKAIFDGYYKTDTPIDRLIKLRRLHYAATELKAEQASDGGELKALINHYFTQQTAQLSSDPRLLLTFSFLQETTFKANGDFAKISDGKEVVSTTARLFVESKISPSTWDDIYKDYCAHVRNSTEMLSGDELNCLAKCWNIQLEIEHPKNIQRFAALDATLAQVRIWNPSTIHWQLRLPPGAIDTFNDNKKNDKDESDPLTWQINKHFSGILERIEHLTENQLNDYLNGLVKAVDQLERKGVLDECASDTKCDVTRILKEHIQRRMACDLSKCKELERDLMGKTDQAPEVYYAYTLPTYARRAILQVASLQNDVSTEALLQVTDHAFFEKIPDPLWQVYLHNHLERLSQVGFYQVDKSKEFKAIEKDDLTQIGTWRACLGNDRLMAQLKEEGLTSDLEEIKALENTLREETLNSAPQNIRDLERDRPGAYVALLEHVHTERLRLELREFQKKEGAENALRLLNGFIAIKGLTNGLSKLEECKLGRCRLKFHEKLERVIERKRLHLYVRALRSREQEKSSNATLGNSFYDRREFNDLGNLDNLMALCKGEHGLGWLVNQVAEYELEIPETIISNINCDELNIDEDVLETITYSLCLHRYYDNLDGNFVARSFSNALRQLHDGTLMEGQDAKMEAENNPLLFNKAVLLREIRDNFAKLKKLIESGRLDRIKHAFNQAWSNNNLIEMQNLWYVFAKFQRLLNSSESVASKSKIAKTGIDYDLECNAIDYDDLLNKAYKSYEERAAQYFRIYPDHSTFQLVYSTKNKDEPRKTRKRAALEIGPILEELQIVGNRIKSKLIEAAPKDNTTNVVVPVLCFAITTEPHAKGGNHGRLFVPIALDLAKYGRNILSQDAKDGVFKDEESFYDAATNEEKYGAKIVDVVLGKVPARFKASLLRHSERVLFGILRNREAIREIVALLQIKLAEMLGATPLQTGRYKVYTVSLLLYSTNSVCDRCSAAVVAAQNSHQVGFLKLLAEELYNSGRFKVRGYTEASNTLDPTKFCLSTIALSDKPFNNQMQAEDIHGTNTKTQRYYNPNAKLFLRESCIDLHKQETTSSGTLTTQRRFFFEFINMHFSAPAERVNKFAYRGVAFMSGSKSDSKYKTAKGAVAFKQIQKILSREEDKSKESASSKAPSDQPAQQSTQTQTGSMPPRPQGSG